MSDRPRALLLDLDGTLADSLPVLYSIYEEFLASFGRTAGRSEFESLNGVPLIKAIEVLRSEHRLQPTVEELFASYQARLGQFYDRVQPNQGARELVARAHELGLKTAIVTSSLHRHAVAWAEKVRLGHVDLVVGGDSVVRGKPDPEPYLKAASHFEVHPSRCIAVEDSRLGLQAAVSAGTQAYLLAPAGGSSIEFHPQQHPGAKGILENLNQVILILGA